MTENEILRAERDHSRAQLDRAIEIMVGINALLSPAPIVHGGAVYVFNPPDARERLQALSDRIRAIPDEISKIGVQNG